MDNFLYGGQSDIGYERENNEDYLGAWELDDTCLLAIIADGTGSKASSLQPASICVSDIYDTIKAVFDHDKELLLNNAELFLKSALDRANRVLGAFKHGNEELYAGFASSVTCVLLWGDGNFAFAHAGNTRLYLIRVNKDGIPTIRAITRDHTVAKELLDKGVLNPSQYYTHPDRLSLTSGLGLITSPEIQVFEGNIKENDMLLLTTDGIHYAIKTDAISDLVMQTETCDDASDILIKAAKSLKYSDNMSAMLIFRPRSNDASKNS